MHITHVICTEYHNFISHSYLFLMNLCWKKNKTKWPRRVVKLWVKTYLTSIVRCLFTSNKIEIKASFSSDTIVVITVCKVDTASGLLNVAKTEVSSSVSYLFHFLPYLMFQVLFKFLNASESSMFDSRNNNINIRRYRPIPINDLQRLISILSFFFIFASL